VAARGGVFTRGGRLGLLAPPHRDRNCHRRFQRTRFPPTWNANATTSTLRWQWRSEARKCRGTRKRTARACTRFGRAGGGPKTNKRKSSPTPENWAGRNVSNQHEPRQPLQWPKLECPTCGTRRVNGSVAGVSGTKPQCPGQRAAGTFILGKVPWDFRYHKAWSCEARCASFSLVWSAARARACESARNESTWTTTYSKE
jgi:hypothetical protein